MGGWLEGSWGGWVGGGIGRDGWVDGGEVGGGGVSGWGWWCGGGGGLWVVCW